MPDLGQPSDLTIPDLSQPPDLSSLDLAQPPDLHRKPAVAVCVLPWPPGQNGVGLAIAQALTNTGAFSRVDLVNLGFTATLATLQQYDAVLTWNETMPGDPVGLGNLFAAYVDGGGGLVQTSYNFVSGYHLTGRFGPGYDCIIPGGIGPSPVTQTPFPNEPNSPLVAGINAFSEAFALPKGTLANGAVSVWDWDTTPLYPFIARCAPGGHLRVDVNLVATTANPNPIDFGTIYKNALLYVIH
jgi:hypothetical protein